MPIIKTDFKRKTGLRDHRLFIIAAEGSDTEKLYFEAIKNKFRITRVQIEVLKRTDFGINETNSSPIDVLKTLDEFKKRYHLKSDDQLWLVIDRDRQNIKDKQLSEIAQQIVQKKYFLALSNPCFELWLLLHFENPRDWDENKQDEYFENKKEGAKRLLERLLSAHLEGYDKAAYDTEKLMAQIDAAITHAEYLPIKENERWHSTLGTKVGELVAQLIPQSTITNSLNIS